MSEIKNVSYSGYIVQNLLGAFPMGALLCDAEDQTKIALPYGVTAPIWPFSAHWIPIFCKLI